MAVTASVRIGTRPGRHREGAVPAGKVKVSLVSLSCVTLPLAWIAPFATTTCFAPGDASVLSATDGASGEWTWDSLPSVVRRRLVSGAILRIVCSGPQRVTCSAHAV